MSPLTRGVISAGVVPALSIALFFLGFILIVLYAYAMTGPHLRYLSVGLLTACAALLGGGLAGLVVGVPRDVSSGALRAKTSRSGSRLDADSTAGRADAKSSEAGAGASANSNLGSFEPSTNLAEISDWLTKLLLGAGLVGLTHLGGPLTRLIDTVARGIGPVTPAGKVTEAAVVMAATILIAYAVLGFLDGYLTTTLWYGKRLQAMFDPVPANQPPNTPAQHPPKAQSTKQLETLLEEQRRAHGSDHPDILHTRGALAWLTALTGDSDTARIQLTELLQDELRVLGSNHPDTFRTRSNLASLTGQAGDASAARDQFAALLQDQLRVLGSDHPDIFRTRSNLASWTGQAGDASAARDQFAALLQDQLRLLGSDHPDTLSTQSRVAEWTRAATGAASG
jgi:hypothetical protein